MISIVAERTAIPAYVYFHLYNHGDGWYAGAAASGDKGGSREDWFREHPELDHLTPHLCKPADPESFWLVDWRDNTRHTDPRDAIAAICRLVEASIGERIDWTCEGAA